MIAPTHREYRDRFYGILENLAVRLGGGRTLSECDGRMFWPTRGVYFFFEPGEVRGGAYGDAQRIVRVGTHAVSSGSKTTLWQRLKQHQGAAEGGAGNHRGSIFRHHVGLALIKSGRLPELEQVWKATEPTAEMRAQEMPLEQLVTEYIGRMRLLWVAADDEPSAVSIRARIEVNAIALLSEGAYAEPASPAWLGRHAAEDAIRRSGLWNVKHVGRPFDAAVLDVFEKLAVHTPVAAAPRANGATVAPGATSPSLGAGVVVGSVEQPVLALVSCTKKKAAVPSRASELYAPSTFFRMAFALARHVAQSTFILSAKHGLVHPDQVVAPYEQTLATAGRDERRRWASATYRDLCARPEYREAKTIIWLAGDSYRGELMPLVARDGKRSIIPMDGLAQGEQLAWLSQNTRITLDEVARARVPVSHASKEPLFPVTERASSAIVSRSVSPPNQRSPAAAPRSADFEMALAGLFERARHESKVALTVNAGELHRMVGGYPGPNQRMPVCCRVLRSKMRQNDRIVAAPPKGDGASLTVLYNLR